MARDNAESQAVPLLPSWEKIKAGVTGFAKTVIGYLPRGILMLGLLLGGSALLGSITGIDPLGVTEAYAAGKLASRIGLSLLVGGLFSGGIGAYENIKAVEAAHQAKHAQAPGNSPSRHIEAPQQQVSFGLMPPSLPQNEKIAKATGR